MNQENTNTNEEENGMANIAEMLKSIMGNNFSLPTHNNDGEEEDEVESYCGDANASIEVWGSCTTNTLTENVIHYLVVNTSEEFTVPPLTFGFKVKTDASSRIIADNSEEQESENICNVHPWVAFSVETVHTLIPTPIRVVPQVVAAHIERSEFVVFVDNLHPTDSYTFMKGEAVAQVKFVVTQNVELV